MTNGIPIARWGIEKYWLTVWGILYESYWWFLLWCEIAVDLCDSRIRFDPSTDLWLWKLRSISNHDSIPGLMFYKVLAVVVNPANATCDKLDINRCERGTNFNNWLCIYLLPWWGHRILHRGLSSRKRFRVISLGENKRMNNHLGGPVYCVFCSILPLQIRWSINI